ncbi:MAG: AI-2E family transporter, partial [Oscillospiraceae bacterium]|nr:AI-2E family transporter [Oscillospiraceae bacterium]
LMSALARAVERLEARALAAIDQSPEAVSDYLLTAMEAAADALYGLPARLSEWVLDALGRIAQGSGGVLLFAVTAGIGTYFVSAAYPRTLAFLRAQLPEEAERRLAGLGRDLRGSFGALLRAQMILMAMTFFELLLGFVLLGVCGAAGLAALTALIDALPVFGTGIVLAPWALSCLLLGDTGRGVGLLICWAMASLVRSCAQAKLLGDQIGLDPLASLLAIYVGWRVWGVWGMLLFPVLLVTLQQLNDKGVLHLWKNA